MFSREHALLPSSPPERGGRSNEAGAGAIISRVDVHESTSVQVQILNAMNEGITSIRDVNFLSYGVARPTRLLSLSLHSNRVSSMEGLASLAALTALNLSSNELDGQAIRSCAPHLGALSCLESLDLSCNRIDALLGLPLLPCLSRLLVPYNRLVSLDGVQVLASSLTFLDTRDNRIAGPTDAHAPHLAALGRLETLVLMSPGGGQANPLCDVPGYRERIFAAAPSLQTLDGSRAGALDGAASGASAGENRTANAVVVAETATSPAAAVAAEVGGGGRGGTVRRPCGGGNGDDATLPASNALPARAESYRPRDARQAALALSGSNNKSWTYRPEVAALPSPPSPPPPPPPPPPPEEVPMPRFDAIANRFRRRREGSGELPRGGEIGGLSAAGGSSSGAISWAPADESASDDWSEGEGVSRRRRGVRDNDRAGAGRERRPEETAFGCAAAGGSDRGGVPGDEDDDGGMLGLGGAGSGEDCADDQGLLSRLRSVAQEARLEVMDSRLQDLHEKQAMEAADARKAALSTAAATAAAEARPRASNLTETRKHAGFPRATSSARGSTGSGTGRGNRPWAQSAPAREAARRARGADSGAGFTIHPTPGARTAPRPKLSFRDPPPRACFGGDVDVVPARGGLPSAGATAPGPSYPGDEAAAECCCPFPRF